MWVARDRNGDLRLFSLHKYKKEYQKPPIRDNRYGIWCVPGQTLNSMIDVMSIDSLLFPNLRWEDDPIEVSIVPFMMNAVQSKLAESIDDYFDYVGHAQDIHPYSKEEEQEYYNKLCWRWQDWNDVKYDHPSTWDLNFDDYIE